METIEITPPSQQTAETLGSGLRAARDMRNLSLRDVEQAVGISNAYLSQLENDRVKKPSPFFLHKLATLYGIDYELLMAKAGYIIKNETAKHQTLAGAALMSEELTSEETSQLAQYLKFLRSQKKANTSNVKDPIKPT